MQGTNLNESAFAVYTGKTSPKKNKKKHKGNLEKINDISLNKFQKLEVIKKKKEKKANIIKKIEKKNKGDKIENSPFPIFSNNILDSVSGSEKKVKKKKKVKINSEPLNKVPGTFKKVVVSTPRFIRKTETLKETKNLPNNDLNVNIKSFNKKKKQNVPSSQAKNNVLPSTAKIQKTKEDKRSSVQALGETTLQTLLDPISVQSFLRLHWEKKPIHIPGREKKFASLISTDMIDAVLRENVVLFSKHLDVTSYSNGERQTHNPEGRAHAHIVWDYYSNGCSVRLLNPQYFFKTVHIVNSNLQELFGCFVGANVYLTPPNSQGFAPHYDDIEAIILQVEGSKIWKIYPPINEEGHLPRFSSKNFKDSEIGEPVMEVTLKAGDVLYFPRGYIHQGRTMDQHSLHITLSTYQHTSWCDFLEKLLPLTLKEASNHDVEFRKGLPIGYLESSGLAYKENPNQMRKQIVSRLKDLIHRLTDFIEIDNAMDGMGLKFVEEALPPVITPAEAACSISRDGIRMSENGKLLHGGFLTPDTRVRWIRKHCYRIIEEEITREDGALEKQTRIYYSLDNSREYRKDDPQFIIIPPDMVPGALHLVSTYPEYTKISDLPLNGEDVKLTFVGDLWDCGLLVTETPLLKVNGIDCMEASESMKAEEAEVYADLLDAVPHCLENQESVLTSDEETMINDTSDESSSLNTGSTFLVRKPEEFVVEHLDSENDSIQSS